MSAEAVNPAERQSALLGAARDGVERAQALGADQSEVICDYGRETRVDLQKDDIHNASVSEEATYGIRVFVNGSMGFATVNDPARLETACEEALALARVSPPDPLNGLGDPRPLLETPEDSDPEIAALEMGALVSLAADTVDRIKSKDPRVVVDSGHVYAVTSQRAIATSTGVALSDGRSVAGSSFFGMAVDGDEVGSFDHDGQAVVTAEALAEATAAAADRFVIKTLGALGAGQGESFRGSVILTPEVVSEFLVSNLLSVLSGTAIRTGRSPFTESLGEVIASTNFTLLDNPHEPGRIATRCFDREGMPTRPTPLVESGVLKTFLYDVYEARAAQVEPTGHARGSAASPPSIGPSNLTVAAGSGSFSDLCCEPERAVVASRFSGGCNPVTGEFSGVVKGGFLMRSGEKTPIKETLMAGNLFDLIKNISGVSQEARVMNGNRTMPSIRVDDVSITAG